MVCEDETSSKVVQEAAVNLARTYHEFANDYDAWHGRMMHINPKLAKIAKPDLKDWPANCFCDNCVRAKFHRHPHSGKRPAAADLPWAPGEYVSCDLFGPLLRSMGGAGTLLFTLIGEVGSSMLCLCKIKLTTMLLNV